MPHDHDRREFLIRSGLLLASAAVAPWWPARAHAADSDAGGSGGNSAGGQPSVAQGLQIGDVTRGAAIVWSRTDRPARMWVEVADNAEFHGARRVRGPYATESTDYTARLDLTDLPADSELHVRVLFEDLASAGRFSEPVTGRLRTAPAQPRNVRLLWSGDTAGQGFGINPEWGGMRIYETMRQRQPDFFIHCGDTIYADGPIPEQKTVEDGRVWRNRVTPEVAKVAETLDEFRGRYRYNLLDENVRRFNAEVPQIWQWDDHEVMNNWSAAKDISADARYTEKNVPLLLARATQAFLEYAPLRRMYDVEAQRVYRRISYGPLLDVFVVDMRSYRGANSANRQAQLSEASAFLGRPQLGWLLDGLRHSQATWKIIAADMPIGLQVVDGKNADGSPRWEAIANGDDGAPSGRELEIAELLRGIKAAGVKNIVWLTADVHYTAAHHYAPERAAFKDFDPFWEFVSGPLNAGSFGPNALDASFGPQVVWQKAPAVQNTSPFAGLQFFGEVNIDAASRALSVSLRDLDDNELFSKRLEAV